MEKVLAIVEQLQATSGRNDKEAILSENANNQLFKDIMKFVYDPFVLTGLSKKKISKKLKLPKEPSTLSIIEIMDYLKVHNSGRDEDIIFVQHFIQSQPENLRDLYTKIVSKDLTLGLTEGTLNKVYGNGFIKTFSVMLAKKFEEYQHKIKGDFVISEKKDGNRVVVIKDNGVIKSFSRQGKSYEGLQEIESDILGLPIDNIVFDGELIADIEGSTIEVYAETTSKARSKGNNKTGLVFHIFDVLDLKEFQNGKSLSKCVARKSRLSNIFETYDLPHCREVKSLYIGGDLNEVGKWMSWATEQGLEGLMVNMDMPYVCKRSDVILKVKVFNNADVRCLEVLEGTGKYENMLGAITIQFEHEGKLYECNCGSGFSDEERKTYYKQPELITGKIVTVGYFEVSKNSNGSYGLRFPTWEGKIRHEMTEISMN